MGIYNALFIGASGLSSFGNAVRIVGDNIANVNTLGFKSQNVNFSDVLSQTLGSSGSNATNQAGNGVRIGTVTSDQQQGTLKTTTNSTDMAINGNGLFTVRDPNTGQLNYTRAGSFSMDKSSNLIDGQGNIVQGYPVDSTTQQAIGSVGNITFANLAAQAQPTSKVTVGATLDSSSAPLPTGTTFNAADPSTYNFKSDAAVYDGLGQTHNVSLEFIKKGQDSAGNIVWDWHASVDGKELKGGTAGTQTQIGTPTASTTAAGITKPGSQSLVFGPAGQLVQENSPSLTFNWLNAAATKVSFNYGDAAGQGTLYPTAKADAQGITGTGLTGTVQMAGSFATRQITADGFASGFLSSLKTDSAGKISGVFTNGQTRPLFQVALAKFPNDAALSHVGNNLLQESISSGTPVLEKPGTGGMGTITPYALEQSNVDLASQFVRLIVLQQGYTANSKTILTTDQMLSSLMQVKR